MVKLLLIRVLVNNGGKKVFLTFFSGLHFPEQHQGGGEGVHADGDAATDAQEKKMSSFWRIDNFSIRFLKLHLRARFRTDENARRCVFELVLLIMTCVLVNAAGRIIAGMKSLV